MALDTNRLTQYRLNKAGVIWWKVEQPGTVHNPRASDMFGLFDFVAITGSGLVAIQVTTRNNVAAHRGTFSQDYRPGAKWYTKRQAAEAWLKAGLQIELWIFDKPEGKVRHRRERVVLEENGEIGFELLEDS